MNKEEAFCKWLWSTNDVLAVHLDSAFKAGWSACHEHFEQCLKNCVDDEMFGRYSPAKTELIKDLIKAIKE